MVLEYLLHVDVLHFLDSLVHVGVFVEYLVQSVVGSLAPFLAFVALLAFLLLSLLFLLLHLETQFTRYLFLLFFFEQIFSVIHNRLGL